MHAGMTTGQADGALQRHHPPSPRRLLIKQVNDDRTPVEIVSNHGRAYLIAADDYESMAETDYLLRSPANAARLMTAAEEVRSGRNLITKTMEELEDMADEDEPR